MAFLEVNGLTIPCAPGQSSGRPERVGSQGRSSGGQLRRTVRAHKDSWAFSTIRLAEAKAEALIHLLKGEGWHWSFEDAGASDAWQYADGKGTGYTAVTGTPARSTAQAKFDAASLLLNDTEEVRWPLNLVNGQWSAMAWWYNGTTWAHYAQAGNTPEGDLFYDNGAVGTERDFFLRESDGDFTLRNVDGADRYIDDLVVFPWLLTSEMIAAFYELGNTDGEPFSDLPELKCSGDLIQTPFTEFLGTVEDDVPTPSRASGSWESNSKLVSFLLEER